MELFKRDGKWLTREQLWEYMKKGEVAITEIKEPIEAEIEEKTEDKVEKINMPKCKSKKKSKK